jgi:four helix bundle protein
MTNGITESLEDGSPEELAFWGFELPCEAMILRDEPPARIYDLEERMAKFGEQIIIFAKKIPRSPINNRLIDQVVGAGTSVGANYCEADDGVSKADFKHRIGTCRKEARETKFFLRMVATAEPKLKLEAREVWREARELHLIFSRIWRSTNTN